jgi:hypothetical protein
MTAPTDYELGTTLVGVATLASLSIPNPESEFVDYSSTVKLASGITRGLGSQMATWHYGYLTQDQYDALTTIMTDISTSVYFSTLTNTGDFARYSGIARLPERYVLRGPVSKLRYIDVTIQFTMLVVQP